MDSDPALAFGFARGFTLPPASQAQWPYTRNASDKKSGRLLLSHTAYHDGSTLTRNGRRGLPATDRRGLEVVRAALRREPSTRREAARRVDVRRRGRVVRLRP